ncbi:hypothetical protein [Aquisphaera insulae]|uniref:hypothetical protein n=1 Tax=Aquisphaera insulae TaxID=2712864 RepID=UPI0013EB25EC|nr:hypothetical protein [Aquisphaera insulae]
MQTASLSELAVAILRLHVESERRPATERNFPAYRELVQAGIMEPLPGAERVYRLTVKGKRDRVVIVEREQERIESQRYAPPDLSHLSGPAWELLRRIAGGEEAELTAQNRSEFRELADARLLLVINTYAGGPESAWRWTYWGWKKKPEWVQKACAKRAVG